jgi:hypothetical protein
MTQVASTLLSADYRTTLFYHGWRAHFKPKAAPSTALGPTNLYDSPGAKLAIETAVHREFMKLRDAYYDKLSRQSVLSRGFIGVEKK